MQPIGRSYAIMIDIHSHILPGIDDGPDRLSQSVNFVTQAYSQGVTAIFATPHSMDGVYQATPRDIISKCSLLTTELKKNNIPVQILPGSEIRLTHDTVSLYDQDRLMTLNNKGTHILLELPPLFITEGVLHIIRKLTQRGVVTIIAHPERNPSIIKNLNTLSKLIYEGALMQITATSLTGGFGKRAMKICEQMLDNDAVSFIGSDIHPGRSYRMLDAYNKTLKIAGEKTADTIFLKNPREIMVFAAEGMNCAE